MFLGFLKGNFKDSRVDKLMKPHLSMRDMLVSV